MNIIYNNESNKCVIIIRIFVAFLPSFFFFLSSAQQQQTHLYFYFICSFILPWVPEGFFSRATRSFVGRRSTRLRKKAKDTSGAKPREKTSGAERLDLSCWMDLDLVSNLSVKSAVARTKGGTTRCMQPKESHYLQNNKLEL